MTDFDLVDSVARKLEYHAAIIERLLEDDVAHVRTSAGVAMLERKLLRLEDMVLEIPDDDDNKDLFDQWVENMIQLWSDLMRFYEDNVQSVSDDDGDEDVELVLNNHNKVRMVKMPTSFSTFNAASASRMNQQKMMTPPKTVTKNCSFIVSSAATQKSQAVNGDAKSPVASLVVRNVVGGGQPVSKAATRGGGSKKQIFRNQQRRHYGNGERGPSGAPPVGDNRFKDLISGPITKESLRTSLIDAFAKLNPVKQLADLTDMQALLTLVAKSVKLLSPHLRRRRDNVPDGDEGGDAEEEKEVDEEILELQDELIEAALEKLPDDVVERWNVSISVGGDEGGAERSLHMLKMNLIHELTEFYNALKEETSENPEDAGEDGEDKRACFYCKELGHLAYRCPNSKTMVCFKCFKNGHKARDCNRRCFKCLRFGHKARECLKN